MSEFNMPPGVSTADIPGNRLRDIEWQLAEENFWQVAGELEPQILQAIAEGLGPSTIQDDVMRCDADDLDAWTDAIMEWRQKHQMLEGK